MRIAVMGRPAVRRTGCGHSSLKDGVRAPSWVEKRKEVLHFRGIEVWLKGIEYESTHGHKPHFLSVYFFSNDLWLHDATRAIG